MTKEEAYKKLCVVLFNSIKEKLKAVNELNIDSKFPKCFIGIFNTHL